MKKREPVLLKREYEIQYAGKTLPEDVIAHTKAARLRLVSESPVHGGRLCGGRAVEPLQGAWQNMLVEGDNLGVLKTLLNMKVEGKIRNADGSSGVRLVYIDPPFSTNLGFKTKGGRKAYDDRITGSAFIEFMRKRLLLLRELLAEDGSIYAHLDWKKAHYVKALMDEIFGEENFLNDIIWHYGGRGAKAVSGQFSRNHDIILWYKKGDRHVFNRMLIEKRVKKGASGFRQDAEGRWFKTSPRGDYTDKSIETLSREGRIHTTKNGNIRIKYFLREDGGCLVEDKLVGDVWDDIGDAMHMPSNEKTGYPTQKPEALLSRIIAASSKEGDIVLDAFAGSGTALAVAEKMGRRWLGVDAGALAVETARKRLLDIVSSNGAKEAGKKHGKPALARFNTSSNVSIGERGARAPFAVFTAGGRPA
ncbi:MAG: site-specific DNA-methyltransferase [Deltaproteobacteria bacterium]|nr:site-specific DNA-methyltransferase [Deltaproteobacteria bacterium]